MVYVGIGDSDFGGFGALCALNASTGALLWKYPTGDVVESSPAVVNGVVYVRSADGDLYAFRL
jgi:eukaryotic-like serine/threonine-protein kinase